MSSEHKEEHADVKSKPSLPQRDGDGQDFVYRLLYTFSKEQVRQAYVSMLRNMKQYIPQISDSTIKLAESVTDHDAMLLHMLLVLVTDETNGFTQYALQNAVPRFRLEYFRLWFADFAKNFMGALSKDPQVPNPSAAVAAARSEYIHRRDNGNTFRKHFNEYVPPGGSRLAGK